MSDLPPTKTPGQAATPASLIVALVCGLLAAAPIGIDNLNRFSCYFMVSGVFWGAITYLILRSWYTRHPPK